MYVPLIKRILWTILVRVLLLIISIASAFTIPTVHAASQTIPPTNHNIKYVGRWDTSSRTVHTSYWPGAYFETKFTGTTVAIRLASSVNIYVKIDKGDDTFYPKANGTVNLTPTPLAPGTHLLRVATSTDTDDGSIALQGLVLDAGAKTITPTLSPKLIEFIGDSITAGYSDSKGALSDYAWLIGEQLGVQHTQIAFSGICLVNIPCFSPTEALGMSRQFFKLQTVLNPNSPNWNFSRYQASAVVINLGTNDGWRTTDDVFQSNYESFLRKIRKVYPKARIFVLRTFVGAKAAPTQDAVQALDDRNIQYIDTTGWLSPSDTNDGIHPSDAGHAKIANTLRPIIGTYLKTLTSTAHSKGQTKKKKKSNQHPKAMKSAAGWALGNFLPYGFAGLAIGRANVNVTETTSGVQTPTLCGGVACIPPATPPAPTPFSFSGTAGTSSEWLYGLTVGAGLDVALTHNIFLRAEYEYVQFRPVGITIGINTVRAGAGIKF